MKKSLWTMFAIFAVTLTSQASGALVISQYVETNSGSTPKGIELWNSSLDDIDFATSPLVILKGTNGAVPSSDFSLDTGLLAAGDVMVVGTSDIGTYLDSAFGAGVIHFQDEPFTFNGDDALVVQLGGVTTDMFGKAGSDPGAAWSGSDVSTANLNIALLDGITTGNPGGFIDPSTRFSVISTDPSGAGGLAGFGLAPTAVAVPEPSTVMAIACIAAIGIWRARRPKPGVSS
ncbi:hypothetical protein K227x_19450 [Rubripirellula lacrimiformis]|uniref:Ice-binding protein C-terminal domain-containing protein n=1 Tax=Rubripirellula lacrimiformis TaxID=1930273 RepID=A0A517N8V6_9BACT|nr:PEP-CTERM sorting domain-containing protein [Rubripirellula lacrimiformis]QDT03561.1 hypothetical protein K227x_19450 [Rubripirellula lacrimiformis]